MDTESRNTGPGTSAEKINDAPLPKAGGGVVGNQEAVNSQPPDPQPQQEAENSKWLSEIFSKFDALTNAIKESGRYEGRMVNVTVFLAFVALIGLIVTFVQTCNTWRGVEIESRAFLVPTFDTAFIARDDWDGKPVTGRFKIFNMGKTPARKIRTAILFDEKPIPRNMLANPPFNDTIPTMGSGEPHYVKKKFFISDEHLLRWEAKPTRYPIYFAIRIEYVDIFGQVHYSYLNLRYTGKEKTPEDTPDDT